MNRDELTLRIQNRESAIHICGNVLWWDRGTLTVHEGVR